MKKLLLALLSAMLLICTATACNSFFDSEYYKVSYQLDESVAIADGEELQFATAKYLIGDKFVLPESNLLSNEGYSFVCYQIEGGNYNPGEAVSVYKDMTVNVKWTKIFAVEFEGADEPALKVESGEVISLPENDGEWFRCWLINGKEYNPGDLYRVNENTVIKAAFDGFAYVMYGEEEETVRVGTVLTLPETGVEHYSRWQLNGGEVYAAGALYTVLSVDDLNFIPYEDTRYTVKDWDGYVIKEGEYKAESYGYFTEQYPEFNGYVFDEETATAVATYATDTSGRTPYLIDNDCYTFWPYRTVKEGEQVYDYSRPDNNNDKNNNGIVDSNEKEGIIYLYNAKTKGGDKVYAPNAKVGDGVYFASDAEGNLLQPDAYHINYVKTSYAYLPVSYNGCKVDVVMPGAGMGITVGASMSDNYNWVHRKEINYVYISSTITHLGEAANSSGNGAFGNNRNLSDVVFADHSNLEVIGDAAFQSSIIEELVIPSSVKTIGNSAFTNVSGYEKLISVILPEGLEYIGNDAFSNSKLTTVSIPNSVTFIGNNAFSIWKSITYNSEKGENEYVYTETTMEKIVMPYQEGSTLTLGNSVFSYWPSVTEIDWNGRTDGASVILNGYNAAFEGLPNLKSLKFLNGMVSLHKLLNVDNNVLPTEENHVVYDYSDVDLKEIESLPYYAFAFDKSLTSVDMSSFKSSVWNNMTSKGAFYNCSNLKEAVMPKAVSGTLYFYDYLFANSGLEKLEITSQIGTGSINFYAHAFENCKNLKSFEYTKASGTATFNASVFEGCSALETVYFAGYNISTNSGTRGENIFKNCTSLESVYIKNTSGSNFQSQYMFEGCTSLKSFHIEANAYTTLAGIQMFEGCSALETVEVIALNNTNIQLTGNLMFNGCSSLKTVLCKNNGTGTGTSGYIKTNGGNMFQGVITSAREDGSKLTLIIDTGNTNTSNCVGGATMWGDCDKSQVTVQFRSDKLNTLKSRAGWKDAGTIEVIPA